MVIIFPPGQNSSDTVHPDDEELLKESWKHATSSDSRELQTQLIRRYVSWFIILGGIVIIFSSRFVFYSESQRMAHTNGTINIRGGDFVFEDCLSIRRKKLFFIPYIYFSGWSELGSYTVTSNQVLKDLVLYLIRHPLKQYNHWIRLRLIMAQL